MFLSWNASEIYTKVEISEIFVNYESGYGQMRICEMSEIKYNIKHIYCTK